MTLDEPGSAPPPRDARQLALRALTRREYASLELIRFLVRKKISRDDAEQAVAQLVRERWIDDQRFSGMLARTLWARGKGPRFIVAQLARNGIRAKESEVLRWVGEAASLTGEPADEAAAAREIVRRRYPGASSDRKVARRAMQALLRRGFSFDVVRKVVLQEGKEPESEN